MSVGALERRECGNKSYLRVLPMDTVREDAHPVYVKPRLFLRKLENPFQIMGEICYTDIRGHGWQVYSV